mmetsp:Transcript_56067/g.126700  ORF Transcript_56067/g.126700 Transcript_56067/m.126700 type:complete len:1283 (+) Transcript_56067:153-4001(+)
MSLESVQNAGPDGAEEETQELEELRLPPMDDDWEREHGPLEGRFVQVLGDDGEEDRFASSRMGWATSWMGAEGGYLVETLAGTIAEVPADKVQEFQGKSCEEGGFDLPWPPLSAWEEDGFFVGFFSGLVAERLQSKGYCVMQATADAEARDIMFEYCLSSPGYKRPKSEFREAYLGKEDHAKVNLLEKLDTSNPGLQHYNSYMKNLHRLLMKSSEDFLSMELSPERVGTMFRTPLQSTAEEKQLDPGPLTEGEVSDGVVESFLDFVKRRRFCAMYIIGSTGAKLELLPRGDMGMEKVSLTCEKDRLIIFRHDLMSYSYTTEDADDLVLMTWIMAPDVEIEYVSHQGMHELTAEEKYLDGQEKRAGVSRIWTFPHRGYPAWVTSFHIRCSGNMYGDTWTAGLTAGLAGHTCFPQQRFDLDLYYDWSGDGEFGKSRAKHCCHCDDRQFQEFDYEFFEWSREFAETCWIPNRLSMEISYMNVIKSGFTRKELRGQHVSYYLGKVPDFAAQQGNPCSMVFPYYMGFTGPTNVIDTACSSTMTTTAMIYNEIADGRANMGMSNGVGIMMDIGAFIAMSSGRMISSRGRSFTFDHSADGYGRGEGFVSVMIESGVGVKNPIRERAAQKEPWEICRFLSSILNQDGKSASITAPSGPAQTAAIKASLREAMVLPPEIQISECHGTGTSLGDPIEVGSSRIVNDPYDRPLPWILGATKTHVGHLEEGSGLIGLLRSFNSLSSGYVTPNIHLFQLNEHFSLEGYPVIMPIECAELPWDCNLGGTNSFGFGGTNGRSDFWCRKAQHGLRGDMNPVTKSLERKRPDISRMDFITMQCPQCLGNMCWVCGVYVPKFHEQGRKHICSAIREDFASYDVCSICYEGEYLYGGPEYLDAAGPTSLYISGTWCAFKEFEEMDQLEDGVYTCAVRLGETRMEKFRIGPGVGAKGMDYALHPVVDNANQYTAIQGPDTDGPEKCWVIDGWADGSEMGTVYKVTFTWKAGSAKSVRWEPSEETPINLQVHGLNKPHTYSVNFCDGTGLKDLEKDEDAANTWVLRRPFGIPGTRLPTTTHNMRFFIVRDHDERGQCIYPGAETSNAQGPDGNRYEQVFLVDGEQWQTIAIQLTIDDAKIMVRTIVTEESALARKMISERHWESVGRMYGLAGSFNNWTLERMELDPLDPGVYRGHFHMGMEGRATFGIAADLEWKKAFYPLIGDTQPGACIVCGPNAELDTDAQPCNADGLHASVKGETRRWEVYGEPGQEMEVTLNLRASDKRAMVLCLSCQLAEKAAFWG